MNNVLCRLFIEELRAFENRWDSIPLHEITSDRLLNKLESLYTYGPTRNSIERLFMVIPYDPQLFRAWNRAMFMMWIRYEFENTESHYNHSWQIRIHWMKLWIDHMFRIYNASLKRKDSKPFCWKEEYVWFRSYCLANNTFV